MSLPVIGIIGAGLIAREHTQSFVHQNLQKNLIVYDVDAAKAASFAQQFEARRAASEDELIEAAEIVWICSPPAYHRLTVERACKAGKTIFCEKPLALSEADVAAIEAAVATSGVTFYMGHSGRWSDPFRCMRKLALEGRIGDLVEVWSRRLGYLNPSASPAWRLDDAASGGVLVELGVHEIDFIRWVGGDWVSATGTGSSRIVAPGRFLDSASALGTLAGGANAHLHLSWAEPRYLWQRGVQGTTGSLFIDDSHFTKVHLWQPGATTPEIIEADDWRHPQTGENMAFYEQLQAVLADWRGDAAFPVTLADGAGAVRAALAIRRSIDSGETIHLEDVR